MRADESRARKLRSAAWGAATQNTCAPLDRWSNAEVFAYLARFDLPIHPAYAMSYGGALARDQIRVDCIGGRTGRGKGRREWEWTYYRDEIIALELLEICR